MDLLFKRYASPFLFIDGMLQTGRFTEFVDNLVEKDYKEREEQRLWEFYLNRPIEISFIEFKEGVKNDNNNASLSANDIETTVQNSMNILQNFNPD